MKARRYYEKNFKDNRNKYNCYFALLFALLYWALFVQDKVLYPNDLYIKMNEMVENKSLIGLSETELIELLGEPNFKSEERVKSYTYSAGSTIKKNILVGR